MFILRPYQQELFQKVRLSLRTHKSTLLQSPTGAGKTAMAANFVDGAVKKNNVCFFVVHRQELIEQTENAFKFQGIKYGIIAANRQPAPYEPVQICSIDTLKARLHKVPLRPRVMIWDECHHVAAAGWGAVFNFYSEAQHVGLSATPERLDGRGLGEYFEDLIVGPSVRWLIDEGYLVDYKYYGASVNPDLSGIKNLDSQRDKVAAAMDKPHIVGDIISHYERYARMKRFIGFSTSINSSLNLQNEFQGNGIMAVHVDGKTDPNDRRLAMQGFRDNNISGLWNVDLFGEGVDVPAVECLIDGAPTQSLAKVMQRWGRVLRPIYAKGYDLETREGRLMAIAMSVKPFAIILDHANNWRKHGYPDDEREWSLSSKKRAVKKDDDEEANIDLRQCENCDHIHRRSPSCPLCGFIYPIKARNIEHIEGELKEMTREQIKKAANVERLKMARTYPELLTLGIMWRINDPETWAQKIIDDRKEYRNKKIRESYEKRSNNIKTGDAKNFKLFGNENF